MFGTLNTCRKVLYGGLGFHAELWKNTGRGCTMHELPSNLIPVTGLSAGSLHLIPRTAPSHSGAKVGVLAACTLAETTALSATSSLPVVKPSNAETSPSTSSTPQTCQFSLWIILSLCKRQERLEPFERKYPPHHVSHLCL